MNCWKCGSETKEELVKLISNWKGYKVTIEGIKAEVCPKCGEKTYDANDIKLIHALSEGVKDNTKPEDRPEVFNLEEVANILRVTNQTVYNMIKSGRLPAKKLGKRWLFLKSEIEQLVKPNYEISIAARGNIMEPLTVEEKDMIDEYLKSL